MFQSFEFYHQETFTTCSNLSFTENSHNNGGMDKIGTDNNDGDGITITLPNICPGKLTVHVYFQSPDTYFVIIRPH